MRSHFTISNSILPSLWTLPDVNDVFETAIRHPLSLFGNPDIAPSKETWFEPTVDVEETDLGVLLSVDLPGLKKEDVKIDVKEQVMTISGERKRPLGQRSYGKFQCGFKLPSTVDAAKIEARMEDGVLNIAIPKLEAAKPRSIEIQASEGGLFSKLAGALKPNVAKTDEATQIQGH